MHNSKLAVLCIFLFILPSISFSQQPKVEIRAAIYESIVTRYAEEAKKAIEYSWEINGTHYEIIPTIIKKEDILGGALTSENFDLLVIPGSGRPYFDAYDVRWKESVKTFVENGGGYIGICGGANLASMGFRERLSPNTMLNFSILKIADVYVNDQQMQEWQYLWKSNWQYGLPPIQMYIPRAQNPIFKGFYESNRAIRYGGGPGMYPADSNDEKCGKIVPLSIYAEEPMEVAPLHYWKWTGQWEIATNVTTDIKGQYATIATTYGKGRIVLFSAHPEKKIFFGGHIEEFPVRPHVGPFTWFVYNWSDGTPSEESYNWWMLWRSAAWAAHRVIPPVNNISFFIKEPKPPCSIFFNGRELIKMETTLTMGITYLNIKPRN